MSEAIMPMPFEAFRKTIADVLLMPEEKLKPETSFQNDLLVDSIRWLEMALKIEKLGVQIPTDALWDIQTVGDAYQYYLQRFTA